MAELTDVREAVDELENYASDIQRSTHHTIQNALRRYVARLDAEPLATLVSAVLPPVDFAAWYASARETIGSMVGSGELDWPLNTGERVSLQRELLRRAASGDVDLIKYTYDFHYIENSFDTNIQQFVSQDFDPFHRDLLRLVLAEVAKSEGSATRDAHASRERPAHHQGSMIFLSHAAVDVQLAEYVETSFRKASSAIDVFRTSRVGQIPSGFEWFSHIGQQLRAATRYVVLLTPASQGRPWVSFETGAAWMTGRKLVPVLGAGLTSSDVIEPLRNLQLLSLESSEQAAQIFRELGLQLSNAEVFAENCKQLGQFSREAVLERAGWKEVRIDGKRYAWDGPIEDLKEGRGVPLPEPLIKALSDHGLRATTGIPDNLLNEYSKGYQEVWHIDERMVRHAVISKDSQVLLVKPVAS